MKTAVLILLGAGLMVGATFVAAEWLYTTADNPVDSNADGCDTPVPCGIGVELRDECYVTFN